MFSLKEDTWHDEHCVLYNRWITESSEMNDVLHVGWLNLNNKANTSMFSLFIFYLQASVTHWKPPLPFSSSTTVHTTASSATPPLRVSRRVPSDCGPVFLIYSFIPGLPAINQFSSIFSVIFLPWGNLRWFQASVDLLPEDQQARNSFAFPNLPTLSINYSHLPLKVFLSLPLIPYALPTKICYLWCKFPSKSIFLILWPAMLSLSNQTALLSGCSSVLLASSLSTLVMPCKPSIIRIQYLILDRTYSSGNQEPLQSVLRWTLRLCSNCPLQTHRFHLVRSPHSNQGRGKECSQGNLTALIYFFLINLFFCQHIK